MNKRIAKKIIDSVGGKIKSKAYYNTAQVKEARRKLRIMV
jgi:hypothetical protein